MSTDSPTPRTRAEARALRAAAEAAEAAENRTDTAGADDTGVDPAGAPEVAASDDVDGRPDPVEAAPERAPDPTDVERASAPSAAEAEPGVSEPEPESRDAADDRRLQEPKRREPTRDRRFGILLLSVLGVLVLVGATLGVLSLTQGPRLSGVQVDPAQAIEVSGSRVILTANQPLAEIDPAQVSVDPAVPFTVDASGRSIGIRFTVPLDDSTTYSVRVADVSGTGGGPSTELTTTFATPASEVFLLRRDADEEGNDRIFRTDLTGEQAVPVFTAERIDDFRATTTRLVVAVEDEDGSSILVMNRDGSDQRELTLPGDGFVTGVQVSDRGGLVGYTYSDRELTDTSGRASVLVTQPLDGSGEPRIVEVADAEASIAEWQFVPDSAAVLFIDWEGALALEDLSSDAGTQAMGNAMSIMGVSRGTYTAIIERTDGSVVQLNLSDGSEEPLPASDPDYGTATSITPYPGGTLRHIVTRDANGLPTGQSVIRVDDDGAATPILEVPSTDTILQVCASPSGQYTAVVVAPDLANNPYDDLLAPLPQTMHTHLLDTASGEELVAVNGFDVSWCEAGPVF
ncbi:Ig-like domain-containing protein [Microbacterium sp. CIAB417]|uniref:Ig-like domain-containing protein n=1 Tax=Microbacterium sp. CIAB417 TaxID=2860287 RepID=UPI001FAD552E|nr:Ig-like domain-containing protein [Microbacterium sp. CIAB417]